MDTKPQPTELNMSGDVDLPEGYQVGEYIVDDKIGEGGFGCVFRATHPLIGKQAAIKVLSRRYSVDPEMLSRFVSEARAVNQIRHRNIIDIFAFGQLEDRRSYFVMELLDGEPLDRYLESTGGAPLAEALAILRPIARALDAAHAKGIAHRDLKPENIFLSRDADGSVYPKLLDFGIAKLLGDAGVRTKHKTRTGAPLGTPSYMSPEQCRGEQVDHRTDIYTFGCVAFQLITGIAPFDGTNDMAIMLKHCSHDPPLASHIIPGLPVAVDEVLGWLMKKEPTERPQNLAIAIEALERASGREPSSEGGVSLRTPVSVRAVRPESSATVALAPTITPSHTLELEPARRSRVPLVMVGLLVAAAAGVAVWWYGVRPLEPAPEPPVVTAPAPVVEPSPPSPPPPSPIEQPAQPQPVSIQITGVPADTRVSGPSGPLGTAPGEIEVPYSTTPIVLTFEAEGHVARDKQVTPSRDLMLEVTLDKTPIAVSKDPPKKKRHRTEKPTPEADPEPPGKGSDDPFSRK